MTTKEKIEVMQAYERGERIENRNHNELDEKDWRYTSEPQWDWRLKEYRVALPLTTKFRVGNIVVRRIHANQPLTRSDIYHIIEQTGRFVLETDTGLKIRVAVEELEDDFINADDVLWFWEYQYGRDGRWYKTGPRQSRGDIKGCMDYRNLVPLYALGFRLADE
jgi:hypothetical protein cfetvA_04615|nr:MAG TPA: hypothetical protein [Caudoviricetes sp.]